MRILVIGDVGSEADFHVGDEAMLEAALDEMRARGVRDITVISGHPPDAAARHGVEAIARLGFSDAITPTPAQRTDRARRILAATRGHDGLAPDDPAADVIRAVAECDGVLIAGGGNLSSMWPEHLFERSALSRLAEDAGKPLVVTGQTLGPVLDGPDGTLLAATLARAVLVGVREATSFGIARDLGVPEDRLALTIDDASFLRPAPGPARGAPYVAATFSPFPGLADPDAWSAQVAGLVDSLVEATGLDVLLVPHEGVADVGSGSDDVRFHAEVGRRCRSNRVMLGSAMDARQAKAVTAGASLVISTRYHPVVFALASAVPAVGIAVDEYTTVKIKGALDNFGLGVFCLPVLALASGSVEEAVREAWQRRDEIHGHLLDLGPTRRAESIDWWDAVHAALDQRGRSEAASLSPATPVASDAPWARTSAALLPWSTMLSRRDTDLHLRLARSRPAAGTARPAGRPVSTRYDPGMAPAEASVAQIAEDQWAQFARAGYLRLGPVLAEHDVEALQQRADDLALGRIVSPGIAMQLDTGGEYGDLADIVTAFEGGTLRYRKIQGLEHDELFGALVRHPLFLEICRRQYGRHAPLSLFRAMIMNKPAGQGTHLPWHQDGGRVWRLDRDPLVTVWVALDPATVESGCVEVIPGSHLGGLLTVEGSTVPDDLAAIHCPPERVTAVEVPAGHGLLLHNWVLHRSGVNASARPRRAFTACLMDGRTLATTTGARFPAIFEDHQPPVDDYDFLTTFYEERDHLRATAEAAREYALSLEGELEHWRATAEAAREYALSLAEECERLRAGQLPPGDTPSTRRWRRAP